MYTFLEVAMEVNIIDFRPLGTLMSNELFEKLTLL